MNSNGGPSNDLMKQFSQIKVMVVGDVMLDQYIHGKVNRMSPEAPVPVLDFKSRESRLGGAANVALNLKGLGAQTWLAAIIGRDEAGQLICQKLEEQGISTAGLLKLDQRSSTIKTRVMDGSKHLLRLDQEQTDDLAKKDGRALIDRIVSLARDEGIQAFLFQDYNKGVLTPLVIEETLAFAHQNAIKTFVDPKYKHFYHYQECTLFKPNLVELRTMVPFDIEVNQTDLGKATSFLRQELGCQFVMVTLSEKGIFLDEDGTFHWLPVQPREIIDVCGAGDTVISMAALSHLAGAPGRQMAQWACLAGTTVCQYAGVQPLNSQMFAQELEKLEQISSL